MPSYSQVGRFLTVTTPLGDDVLFLRRFSGRESLSRPFRFDLELVAVNGTDVPFEGLLGQRITAHLGLSSGQDRHFNGVCSRVSETGRDATFTYYRLEVVPELWLLSLRTQCRVFQQVSVPDILKMIFVGLNVSFRLKGTYHPRDYCVQYNESDLDFASRLLEEEGIFYFFTHSAVGHQLVIADVPVAHPPISELSVVVFGTTEVGPRRDDRITSWEKSQSLRPGQFTLRDHCFELPNDPLNSSRRVAATSMAGRVEHDLRPGPADRLEDYRYPGGYAQRFDGVDPSGGNRAADLHLIPADGQRVASLRAQESGSASLVINGSGNCRELISGHRFTLQGHFNADGPYVLLSVDHDAELIGDYRSDSGGDTSYKNRFECFPAAANYRPARLTAKPVVHGTQTAVVVGPSGEEIFTDKYGRVKVQFPWDREGKYDAGSSCWVRVGSPWAGKSWGAVSIPRIGQEVVVAFEEGDPDRPIIIGSVYNADQMPPYPLPSQKMVSGTRSNSYPGGGGSNELNFDDTKGRERMYIHAQYNQDSVVGHHRTAAVKVNDSESVGNNQSVSIGGNRTETVTGAENYRVGKDRLETVVGDRHLVVKSRSLEKVASDRHVHVGGNHNEKVDGAVSLTVGTDHQEKTGTKYAVDSGQEIHLKAGMKVIIEAGLQLTIKGPGGFIDIGPSGVTIQGTMVLINSGGAAGSGSGSSPTAPTDAKEAK